MTSPKKTSEQDVTPAPQICLDNVSMSYAGPEKGNKVVNNLSYNFPSNAITSILGVNGCGKSTLLKLLGRFLKPETGSITFQDKPLNDYKKKEFAQKVSYLPQFPMAPENITVKDLCLLGREPHRNGLFSSSGSSHDDAVRKALEQTSMTEFKDRTVSSLSGGQRQRVWIAMSLAQDTEFLLLDEPTTYLDISHQIEILNLLRSLQVKQKKTIILVMHDLNFSSKYSDNILMMKKGNLVASGTPKTVLTPENIQKTYDIESTVIQHPILEIPHVLFS